MMLPGRLDDFLFFYSAGLEIKIPAPITLEITNFDEIKLK